MRPSILALYVAAFIAVCSPAAAQVVGDGDLLQVSLLHRHGARQEPIFVDGELTWDFAVLTPAGEAMALNLGHALRERYGTFLALDFDRAQVASQSTDISRTIQTGFGVLSGLFNATNSIPFLDHIPMSVDYMLAFASNFPSRQLTSSFWRTVEHDDALATEVLGDIGVAQLVSLFGEWCSARVMLCALYAEDVAQCRRSNGGLTSELWALFPKLRYLQMLQNQLDFGINASSPFAPAGAVGYPLANKWMQDATQALAAPPGFISTKLFHYSAHDNTVAGLYAALGAVNISDNNSVMWVPLFLETVLMETYSNGTVHFFSGVPELESNSSFEFGRFSPLSVGCMASDGSVSYEPRCALSDVYRFLNASASPTAFSLDPAGDLLSAACWLPPSFQTLCDNVNANPSTKKCASFRAACRYACVDVFANSVYDDTDGSCQTFVSESFASYATPGIFGGLGGLVLGAIVGRLIAIAVAFEDVRFPEDKAYLQAVEEDEDAEGSSADNDEAQSLPSQLKDA